MCGTSCPTRERTQTRKVEWEGSPGVVYVENVLPAYIIMIQDVQAWLLCRSRPGGHALCLVQAFLPLLGVDADLQGLPGRIVMVSSVVGKLALPFIGSYAASKHALEGMSTSLRRELMLYGVDVIVIGKYALNDS